MVIIPYGSEGSLGSSRGSGYADYSWSRGDSEGFFAHMSDA